MTLLNLRATPIDNKLPSPAELLLGKPISTLLPNHGDLGQEEQRKYLQQKRERMKEEYDKRCQQELPPLYKGQAVKILDKNTKTWCPATITKKCEEPRSYIVQTPNGTNLRRNRSHLRELMTGPITHVTSNNEELPHTKKEPNKTASTFNE